MGWVEAADLIVKGMEGAINAKTVTYDFERLMDGAKLLKTCNPDSGLCENGSREVPVFLCLNSRLRNT